MKLLQIITFLLMSINILGAVEYKLTKIVSGLNAPWGMAFLDEKVMLITGKYGDISLLDMKNNSITALKNTPKIFQKGQGGLLDIQRNPQGLVYDKTRDILFECEHDPRGGDEINIFQKGKNYGWARVSPGKEYWNFSDVGEAKSLKGM